MSWRIWVRHALDCAALATGRIAHWQRRSADGLTVLMYHRVLPDALCAKYPFQKLVVPESHFRGHVDWLAEHAHVLPMVEALALPAAGNGRKPVVAVTFDDGYFDNAEVAAPILEARGLRATFYVTTGFVEGGVTWFDKAATYWSMRPQECRDVAARQVQDRPDLPKPADLGTWMTMMKRIDPVRRASILRTLDASYDLPGDLSLCRPMTVEQVRGLHARGHEVGNHTLSHGILPQYSGDELDREIGGAREILRGWTGADVTGFCYPNGDHDETVIAAVRRAGHTYACTVERGLSGRGQDPYRLPRRMMSPDSCSTPLGAPSLMAFRAEAFGLHDALRSAY
jgi:peptidoglycan/xylan/chitin deacetylase (PgdA/CDA1 family)